MGEIIYSAAVEDVGAAVQRIRGRLQQLAEPRLYFMAIALTILVRKGQATAWRSWEASPPTSAVPFGRRQVQWAMWQLLGTQPAALLRTESQAAAMLAPGRVMPEVFYNPRGPLTLVSEARIPGQGSRNALRLSPADPAWRWSEASAATSIGLPEAVEYNPVNTLNQQNGIKCSLPAISAAEGGATVAESTYALERHKCPHYSLREGSDPFCGINGEVCGGQGAGGSRARTKPRLLVPAVSHTDEGRLLVPGAISDLVDKATNDGACQKPNASDLALLVAWCAAGGSGLLDSTRLLELIGTAGLNELLEKE